MHETQDFKGIQNVLLFKNRQITFSTSVLWRSLFGEQIFAWDLIVLQWPSFVKEHFNVTEQRLRNQRGFSGRVTLVNVEGKKLKTVYESIAVVRTFNFLYQIVGERTVCV